MKKTGIIFVVLCLALSLIGIFSAEAQAQLTLQLSSAEASRGEDVTLVLSASNNPGVSYLSLMFEYDKTRLAFNGFDHAFSASDFPGTWSENGMIINWLGAENIMYEGEILKLNFTVLDDAGPGDAVVNVSADPDDDPALQKSEDGPDGVDVDVDYGAGKVTIPEESVPLPESITLDQNSAELEAGDTLVLTAEILPEEADQSVTWESSDPDVASVDENGTVTAISEGTATITATSDADESLSDSCVITVIGTENPGILPESIALAGAAPSSLAIGEGTRISATILPEEADQTVIWESSDPNVATVDEDGVITAVGEGAVTIRGFSQVDPRLVVAVRISVTGREPEQEQPRQPEPDRTFWKLHENDILPRTGFSAIRPQAIGSLPLDITYEPLRWSIEIPSANVKSDIVEVPFVDGEYPVTWLGSDLGLLEDSSLPGDGTAVLVGHNHLNTTDAGPLAFLDLLEEDTRIFVHDPRNNIRIFVVYANEKVSETDVRAVEKLAMEAENSLILITCEDELVGGGYANRRIIAAKPY